MRKIIWLMHVSLDGFVAGPNGEMDWIRVDDDIFDDAAQLTATADTALFGRVTYQMMESYWPTAAESPTATKHDIEHARWINHAPKIVFSRTLEKVEWKNSRIVRDNIREEMTKLKEQPGKNLLNGSLPWEIEFRDGVSKLTADLSQLPLRALDLNSASQVIVTLPQPSDTVFVHISGSVSNFTIHRPAGVAVRVHISGSASNLTLDEQRFGAVAGGIRWQTPDYNNAAGGYDITITGSVSDMTITTW